MGIYIRLISGNLYRVTLSPEFDGYAAFHQVLNREPFRLGKMLKICDGQIALYLERNYFLIHGQIVIPAVFVMQSNPFVLVEESD
jgi:hypothetical protein